MFGNKRDSGDTKRKGASLMAQMGMTPDLSAMENELYGDLDNDAELEAELAALQGHDSPKKTAKPAKGPVHLSQIDKMAAECMKDDDGEDDDIDLDDPELLAELDDLSPENEQPAPVPTQSPTPAPRPPPSGTNVLATLEERFTMYQTAIANAKQANEGSKQRRYERGLKTLQGQIKTAKAGKPVCEDDIPPPVATGGSSTQKPDKPRETPNEPEPIRGPIEPGNRPPVPLSHPTSFPTAPVEPSAPPKQLSPTAPPDRVIQPTTDQETTPSAQASHSTPDKEESDTHKLLVERKEQYKQAAIQAKRAGDNTTAAQYLKVMKQFENVIKAVENNQSVDLSKMPPPPGAKVPSVQIERDSHQASPDKPASSQGAEGGTEGALPETTQEEAKEIFNAPEAPKSVLEALEQRLAKYKESEDKAKAEGNNSKARRHGRIVKQYIDAIKSHKAGRPVDYEELPTPPGFDSIPSQASMPQASPQRPAPQQLAPPGQARGSPGQVSPGKRTPSPNRTPQKAPSVSPSQQKILKRSMSAMSKAEQQSVFLKRRQQEFRTAAMEAKSKGDIELAKKYLRLSKGFDQMIEASEAGLPVDMKQIPKSPYATADDEFEFVQEDDCAENEIKGDRNEMYTKLQDTLIRQIRTSTSNSEHFTQLGDVSTATKFDKMSENCRKDLDALKNAYKHGDPVPRFHYETRQFSLVQSCTDLGDNEVELTIIRGIQLHLPSGYSPEELDTYVTYEFPFPNESPQKDKTDTCKDTNNPEYNQSFKIEMNRKSRSFARVVKSKAIKLEIFYKRGFFKGDKLLGTASIKLAPLESKCILHESFDLMDGRKSIGGKLEVKVRIRNPFSAIQVEEVKEKWLVIDKFDRTILSGNAPPIGQKQATNQAVSPGGSSSGQVKRAAQGAPVAAPRSNSVTSNEVLKYEKQLLEKQISSLRGKLSAGQEDALMQKSRSLQQNIDQQKSRLQQGGMPAYRSYLESIERSIGLYHNEAVNLVKAGDRDKAQTMLQKKKIVENEVQALRTMLSKR
ncbi:unnamed protein product [Owenia fusiformis]|uniref:Uncharacterized protein n=1 Tax=Owenia fusiformis TaxID=6347 RepID=A0A8J1Y0K8_OWEFU|nr:unnamed protein product [Owenia fusiformis]